MQETGRITILSARTRLAAGVVHSQDLGLAPGAKVTARILHGGRQEGVVEILVDAGHLKLSILPTRGMGIRWARFKGRNPFWKSTVREAVYPMYANLERNGGLGWMDSARDSCVAVSDSTAHPVPMIGVVAK